MIEKDTHIDNSVIAVKADRRTTRLEVAFDRVDEYLAVLNHRIDQLLNQLGPLRLHTAVAVDPNERVTERDATSQVVSRLNAIGDQLDATIEQLAYLSGDLDI